MEDENSNTVSSPGQYGLFRPLCAKSAVFIHRMVWFVCKGTAIISTKCVTIGVIGMLLDSACSSRKLDYPQRLGFQVLLTKEILALEIH